MTKNTKTPTRPKMVCPVSHFSGSLSSLPWLSRKACEKITDAAATSRSISKLL
jgi:hypothetical protein